MTEARRDDVIDYLDEVLASEHACRQGLATMTDEELAANLNELRNHLGGGERPAIDLAIGRASGLTADQIEQWYGSTQPTTARTVHAVEAYTTAAGVTWAAYLGSPYEWPTAQYETRWWIVAEAGRHRVTTMEELTDPVDPTPNWRYVQGEPVPADRQLFDALTRHRPDLAAQAAHFDELHRRFG